eukprot:m51a1_g10050 hypothetical protein (152) ;mRNA; r:47451-49028
MQRRRGRGGRRFEQTVDDPDLAHLLECDIWNMPMVVAEGRLAGCVAPRSLTVVLDEARRLRAALEQEYAVLAVSGKSRRGLRGICGLGVTDVRTTGSRRIAHVTWLLVAKRGPAALGRGLWCSALGDAGRTRVVADVVKGEILRAFGLRER